MTDSSKSALFSVKSNLGTSDAPFFVERDLGLQESIAHAQQAATIAIKDCQSFMVWFLFKNGENTNVKLETSPSPEKGLAYQLNVTGNTMSDVELAIEEALSRINNEFGFDSNETSSFSFDRVGTEYIGPDEDVMS